MDIDEIIKAIRKEINMSQEQFARDLNISFTTINRWENKRSKPSRMARMRIAKYCTEKGVSIELISQLKNA